MRINEFALSYLKQANAIFKEINIHYKSEEWNLVVRRCQEVVELALKSLLRSLGFEVPHRHDIGFVFIKNKEKLPEEIKNNLESIVQISRDLSNDRENSFYGDESTEMTAQQIYFKSDADISKKEAEMIFSMVDTFFENICKNTSLPESREQNKNGSSN